MRGIGLLIHTNIKLGIPKAMSLADFLPAITIKAKDFAAEIAVQ